MVRVLSAAWQGWCITNSLYLLISVYHEIWATSHYSKSNNKEWLVLVLHIRQMWSNSGCLKATFWAVFVLTVMFQNKSILLIIECKKGPLCCERQHYYKCTNTAVPLNYHPLQDCAVCCKWVQCLFKLKQAGYTPSIMGLIWQKD